MIKNCFKPCGCVLSCEFKEEIRVKKIIYNSSMVVALEKFSSGRFSLDCWGSYWSENMFRSTSWSFKIYATIE